MGAMPSLPHRAEVEQLLASAAASGASTQAFLLKVDGQGVSADAQQASCVAGAGGGGGTGGAAGSCFAVDDAGTGAQAKQAGAGKGKASSGSTGASAGAGSSGQARELVFAARLNSMKSRVDLMTQDQQRLALAVTAAAEAATAALEWEAAGEAGAGAGGSLLTEEARAVLMWIARQGAARGLGAVYLNFPQQLPAAGLTSAAVTAALSAAGLKAGGINMRYPTDSGFMMQGTFSHPEPAVRQASVELTVEGCRWAAALGAPEVVVWSATDGYGEQGM